VQLGEPSLVSRENVERLDDYMTVKGGHFLLALEATRANPERYESTRFPPETLERMGRAYRRLAAARDLPLVDCPQVYAQSRLDEDAFFLPHDPIHPTPAGARILAERLAQTLWAQAWIPVREGVAVSEARTGD